MSLITLYGHRGGGDPWPDSTLPSYEWGMDWGADFVEPDLYLTKDGVLVVSHDNIAQGFANVTYAQALAMNPSLLTFGQVIDLVKKYSIDTGRDIGIIPETKSTDYATSLAVVQTLVAHGFTDPNRVVIQSFSATNLQQLHDTIMPQYGVDFQLLQLTSSGITNVAQVATYADIIAPSVGSFSAADVAAAHAAGLKVVAWTITGAQSDIQSLVNLGVDGVFVDNAQMARPGEEALEGINVIYGSAGANTLADTTGNDMVYAMQGDDIVRASSGNDALYGDAGDDVLFGGAGNDTLTGGSGTDYLDGGDGTDVLDGSAGNDVIVASGGDTVLFRPGDGIDLVLADNTSDINVSGIRSSDVTVIQDGTNLIIRAGDDALVIRGGADAGHQPGSIAFADGVTWTGADLAAHATIGTDAAVEAALPGLEFVLARAPGLATPSTIAVGTDLVANDGLGDAKRAEQVANVEDGAVYRLSFSLADRGGVPDDGVKVLWNGQVLWQGVPDAAGTTLHFEIDGGAGDGSHQLVFAGAGTDPTVFDASLSGVHFVKLADPGVPELHNAAPVASAGNAVISQYLAYSGQLAATDADGDPLVYSLGDGPAHGSLKLNADGSFQYTPTGDYTGTDGFTYVVSDGHGGAAEAAIGLTIRPGVQVGTDLIVNGSFEDLTGAYDQASWGYRNGNGIIAGWTEVNHNRAELHSDTANGVSAADGLYWFDMDGYANNADLVQQVAHVETGAIYRISFSLADADGTTSDDGVRVLFAGQVLYDGIPTNPWQTFSFTVVGGSGDGSNKLEFIGTEKNLTSSAYGAALDNVHFVKLADVGQPAPGNQAPDAQDGSAEGLTGGVISGTLTATDANNDVPLTFRLQDAASHGSVVVNADGTFKYTPVAGFTGDDAFTFTVDDGHGGTDSATERLTVDATGAVGIDLIVNGGFEDHTGMTGGSTGWTNATGVLPGWTDKTGGQVEIHSNTLNSVAPIGTSYFDLDGNKNNDRIGQVVQGVVTGATYRLQFSIADLDSTTTDDSVAVYWGGQKIYAGTPKNIWQQISVDVLGGAGDGSNKLEFAGTATNLNGTGAGLDAISLVRIDANPNLIVNGSFEDLTGSYDGNWTGDWGYRNDNGIIPGWTNSTGKRSEQHFDTQNGVKAKDGNVWVDLDGNKDNTDLVQTVGGIQAGKTYALSFSTADADGTNTDDGVKVYWGGQLIYTGLPTNAWHQVNLEVVGGAGNGLNKLEFAGNETKTLSGTGAALDDVSLRLLNGNPNLIVNGSFEDLGQSTGYNGAGDWGYRNTNGVIAGWTDLNGNRIEQHWDTLNGISAKDGFILVDLDGLSTNTKMVQTVAGAQTGATYDLTFSIADFDSATSTDGVRVSWGGQVVYAGLPPRQGWQAISLHVVGGAGDGSNKLMFEGTGASLNGYGAGLDAVALRAAVETPITGSDASEALAGTAGHDVFDGGKGNDTLTGGDDADTYLYGKGDGSDVIVERAGTTGTDVLVLQGINAAGVTFHQFGQDVEVVLQDGSLVTLKDQLTGNGAGIEMVGFADGSHLDAAGIASQLVDSAPVITSVPPTGAVTEWSHNSADEAADTPHVAGGSVTFTDADVTDTHTVRFAPEAAGYLGTFTLDRSAIAAGSIGWSFTVDDRAIDHLAAGQMLTQTYDVTIDDGLGGTAMQPVTITITGTDDGPVPAIPAVSARGAGALVGSGSHYSLDLGTMTQGDPRVAAVLHLQNIATGLADPLAGTASLSGTITAFINSGFGAIGPITAGGTSGELDISLNTAAVGSFSETVTFALNSLDSAGSTVLTPVTITVTGTVAAPPGQVYTLSAGADTVSGSAGANTILAGGGALSAGDLINGGGNPATNLVLQGAGVFDLTKPATLTGIRTITAQEGQASSTANGKSFVSAVQTITLRSGMNGVTLNVTAAAANPDNPKAPTITIIGAANDAVINLGSGNDTVTLGAGETVNGGSGNNLFYVSAATIHQVVINGGSGSNTMWFTGGGAISLAGAAITNISTVYLQAAAGGYDFTANAIAGMVVQDGNTATFDRLTAGGANQVLTGGGAGKLTMTGAEHTTFRNSAALFNNDTITNFGTDDLIDITGLGFAAVGTGAGQTSLGLSGSTLTVSTGGVQKTAINLNGSFNLANFTVGSDGSNGTLIGYHA